VEPVERPDGHGLDAAGPHVRVVDAGQGATVTYSEISAQLTARSPSDVVSQGGLMLGMIAAVALLASLDDQLAPSLAPAGGEQQHVDDAAWSGRAAGMGALGVVGGDVVALLAGAALARVTPLRCSSGDEICIHTEALLVAAIGLVTLPPLFALLLAQNGRWDTHAFGLTVLAQGAAIVCIVAGANSSGTASAVFLASAAAFHFVGIPLAVGLVPARTAQGTASQLGTPTLSLALSW